MIFLAALARVASLRLAAVWSLFGCVLAGCGPAPPDARHSRALEIQKPVRASIAGGDQQRYRITLESEHTVRILIDQRETDLAAAIEWPEGGAPQPIDAREHGIESVTVIARTGGQVALVVRSADTGSSPSAYDIRLEGPPREATERDRLRERAERLATEGKELARHADPDSRERALALLSRVAPLWRDLDDPAGAAIALAMAGDVLHGGGQLDAADAAYAQALIPGREAGDRRVVAELLNNLGVLDWRRGRLREASVRFEEALTEWQALPFPRGAAATLANQGNLFFESGDYQRALDRFQAADQIFEEERDARGQAYALNNIGVTNQALGDLEAAFAFLTRATSKFEAVRDAAGEGRAHLRLGRIHLARGESQRADNAIAEGLTLVRRADDRLGEADALDLAGLAAAASGDASKALAYHEEARSRYAVLGSRRGEATALHHAGAALMSLGKPADALELLSRALEIRGRVGLRDAEAETLHQMALAERQVGRAVRARGHLEAALAITEEVRGRVAGEHSRRTYFSSRQSYYAAQIDLLMQLHARDPSRGYAAEAFETSERERARSLLDVLEESSTNIRLGVDRALLAREQELRRQLDFWAYRLAALADRPSSDGDLQQVRGMLAQLIAEYRRVEAQIRATSQEYAALVSQLPITVEEAQRGLLDANTALLRFALGDRQSYLWVITHDALRAVTLPDKSTIDRVARRVSDLVSKPPLAPSASGLSTTFDTAASELSDMLLGPVAADLKGRRLLIVSEGSLQLVPFAALPEPGGGSPLVVGHEIVMLPSATTLAVLRRQLAGRAPARKAIAVLADSVYDPEDPRIDRGRAGPGDPPFSHRPFSLPRLPFSGLEAKWILSLVSPSDGSIATGFAASRDAAASAAMRDFRIVHFAAHALLDDDHPELSGIAFSLFDEKGAAQDGLLRLHEIHERLDLRADLVVISACQTALGRDIPGEGLMGLARAFFGAGAARVVASLYSVPDVATAQLMREFYTGLFASSPLTPAAALRAAQMRMLSEPQWRDPYYWSAFVLLGEPR